MCVCNPNVFTGMRKTTGKLADMCLQVWVIAVRALSSLTLSSVDSFVFTAFLPEEVPRPLLTPLSADFLRHVPETGLGGLQLSSSPVAPDTGLMSVNSVLVLVT